MQSILARLGLTQKQVAKRLGLAESTVSLKVNGHRPWMQSEIDSVLALLREREPSLTYEQLFGSGREAA